MKGPETVEIDITPAMLEMLAGCATRLRDSGFAVGEWRWPKGTFPYFNFDEEVSRFEDALYQHGWVLTEFDWPDWSRSREAQILCEDREALASASPEQLAKLITSAGSQGLVLRGQFGESVSNWVNPCYLRARSRDGRLNSLCVQKCRSS